MDTVAVLPSNDADPGAAGQRGGRRRAAGGGGRRLGLLDAWPAPAPERTARAHLDADR